jgi:hypothetical protein
MGAAFVLRFLLRSLGCGGRLQRLELRAGQLTIFDAFHFEKIDGLRVPPPLPVYWNLRLSAKTPNNLWAAITCGQNPERQGVRGLNLCMELVREFCTHRLPMAIFGSLNFLVKVGCHRSGLWKKVKIPTLSQNTREGWGTRRVGTLQELARLTSAICCTTFNVSGGATCGGDCVQSWLFSCWEPPLVYSLCLESTCLRPLLTRRMRLSM